MTSYFDNSLMGSQVDIKPDINASLIATPTMKSTPRSEVPKDDLIL